MFGKTILRAAWALLATVMLAGCPPQTDVKPEPDKPGTDKNNPPTEPPTPVVTAVASTRIEPRSSSTVSGKASFEQGQKSVRIVVEVSGATPGLHGLHLHEKGDCSGTAGEGAGELWNPAKVHYTGPATTVFPLGDLGNIQVGSDGKGKMELLTEQLTVMPGDKSVVGRALIVREKPNDRQTDPSGNSGQRFGCGVITASQPTPAP